MHLVTTREVCLLLSEALNSPNKIARLLLHSQNSVYMQCMLIAFAPCVTYPAFSDNLDGNIVFTCIHGELRIDLFSKASGHIFESYNLRPGELVSFSRRFYRSTTSYSDGAVFLESIEGAFAPDRREYLLDLRR